ncbi:MAG: hypothetical protein RM022_010745 [Nostoc sp. EfeVER01]|nr:hypothetical protein [Nostoc sp. EspVER01]MDZ7995357.1 hypothetical protein [Nostoc sp. EspVER01]
MEASYAQRLEEKTLAQRSLPQKKPFPSFTTQNRPSPTPRGTDLN